MLGLSDMEARRYRLCHGIAGRSSNGQRVGHGWVEDNDTDEVLNFRKGRRGADRYGRLWFYSKFEVTVVARYSAKMAAKHGQRTGNHGPWARLMFESDVLYAEGSVFTKGGCA
jgi:hypothetical protein